jgi:molybdopterin-guanine dinucleotide biosynthesis protein B
MPKIVAVVGGKHSGKTTIIENVTKQLRNRGYHVGAIKEMVRIPTLDTPETETDRYTSAGMEAVVAAPLKETVIFLKRRLSLNEILQYLQGLDYILLEGFETEKTLPKIVAAKTVQEASEFSDGLAIAISGIITESEEETAKATALKISLLSSIREAEKLADIVEQKAFAKLPDLPHCSECGYASCYDLAKGLVKGESRAEGCMLTKKEEFTLEVNGIRIPLKEFPQQILQHTLEGMIESLDVIPKIKNLKIEIKKNV